MKEKIFYIFSCVIITICNAAMAQPAANKSWQTAIDTSFYLRINGVDQYLEIKGASRLNPVILFIHGGPSWPATPMIRKYNQDVTDSFVLVSWDQRNCGKSKTDSTVKLTPDVYVEDAHLVTQYLKNAFQTRKIIVACHSWGTIVGIYLVLKYPEDYTAYVGMGQFVNPLKSDVLGRAFVTEQAQLQKDSATLNALAEIPFTEVNGYENGFDDLVRFNLLANKFYRNADVAGLPDPTQLYDDYKAIDWMTPFITSGKILFNYINETGIDFFQYKDFRVPMYFFVGKYDHNTSATIAEQYFETIKAPKKKLIWFEHSGHSPNWEEPTLFFHYLLKVAAENKAG